jgi:hypothetical protein
LIVMNTKYFVTNSNVSCLWTLLCLTCSGQYKDPALVGVSEEVTLSTQVNWAISQVT